MNRKRLNGRTARNVLSGMAICFCIAVPASAQVLINEVVTDPQQDWNDSAGGDGVGFNLFPGTGTVTASDEWIELLNASSQTIDFTSWTLEMVDTTPATEIFTSGSPTLHFPFFASFTDFRPGARLIVGNPAGEINNNVYLVLRDGAGAVVDAVELGAGDFAGDGPLNNAPSGNARALFDEAVARLPDGANTGRPQVDFQHVRTTIARMNPRPLPPPVVLINEIVTDPQQDWNDSQGGNGVAFDSVPGNGASTDTDEWIELVNVSAFAGSILNWTLVMHDTTPATETLGRDNATFFFELGGDLDVLLPGEHVIVGNPAGTMNNNVWIRLFDRDGRLVNEVELGNQDFRGNGQGDEAPNGNATSASNEAVARLPEATDTGDNAVDFSQQPASIARSNGSTPARLWHLYR